MGIRQKQVDELLRRAEFPVRPSFGHGVEHGADVADCHSGFEYLELAERMFRAVRKEVLFIDARMNGFHHYDIERFRGGIAALRARSVAVSLICHPDDLEVHGRQDFLESINREHGALTRISTVRLQSTFIFDRRYALVWNPQNGRHCALVHAPVIVEPLVRLTDAAWEGASDLETFVRCRESMLDEKTPGVLRLLGSGCKDEVAARELGISVRTYRRHVAGLMEMLDAESRFEAGVKAAALGLIEVDVRDGAATCSASPPGGGTSSGIPRQRSGTGIPAANVCRPARTGAARRWR